jgi:hypothetical protein
MNHWLTTAVFAALLLAGLSPGHAQTAVPDASDASATEATAPREDAAATEATSVQLRVYRDLDQHRPSHRTDDTALGIDTTMDLATCPNGEQRIARMSIGGLPYETVPDCPGSEEGSVRVDGGPKRTIKATAGTPSDRAPTPTHCDPARWRCAPGPEAAPPESNPGPEADVDPEAETGN